MSEWKRRGKKGRMRKRMAGKQGAGRSPKRVWPKVARKREQKKKKKRREIGAKDSTLQGQGDHLEQTAFELHCEAK